ncbi:MAG: ATP-binding cassette domain-containing protein, partial [Pseudomonadales bacterium]
MSLELRSLSVTTSTHVSLFTPVDILIASGEVACVMGPSGVGKSTLLNAIGGHLSTHFSVTGEVL